MSNLISNLLAHPLTRSKDLDDPMTTALRLQIIQSKPLLRKIYEEWYDRISTNFEEHDCVLELGSGAGFMRDFMPNLITSELFPTPGVASVIDAQAMNLDDCSLDGIVMTDVLHHIPDCSAFFHEANRVVKPGGKIVMVEPWNNRWARWVYTHLHHEPFEPSAKKWQFPQSGPLSGANGALPWIIFERDRSLFLKRHPEWDIESIISLMPLVYLLSGGVSLRNLLPGWLFGLVRSVERLGFAKQWGMFAEIVLVKNCEH